MKTVKEIAQDVQSMLQAEKEEHVQNILYDHEQTVNNYAEYVERYQKLLAKAQNKYNEMLAVKDVDEFLKLYG